MDNTGNFQAQLQSTEFLCSLAFLTDMTNQLNMLNLSLQKKGQSISHFVGQVESFCSILRIFTDCLQNNDLAHLSCCSVIEEEYSNADFAQFISNIALLSEKFHIRFEDFHKLKVLLLYTTIPCKLMLLHSRRKFNSSYVIFRMINFIVEENGKSRKLLKICFKREAVP